MNYYTIKGYNANKFYHLNLNPDLYYDWEDVKKRAEQSMLDINDDKIRDEIESNISQFQEIIDARHRREKSLKHEFNKKNIKFILHSYLTRNFIMYGRKKLSDVVSIMHRMKILFEKCDISNQWEKYKILSGRQIYSFEEKDEYFKKIYLEHLKTKQ